MTIDQVADVLLKETSFVISTHKYCDGDGLGGGMALYYALKKLNKEVSFITLETPDPKYKFLDPDSVIKTFDKTTGIHKNLIVLDTNDSLLIEPLYEHAKKQNTRVYFVDHHPIIHSNKSDSYFIDSTASSVAEIVYDLLNKLNVSIDEKIATALFTSIVFDTNQFRNIKNSKKPFEISSKIIPYIKDVNVIYENLFQTLTINDLKFFTKIQDLEYHFNNQVALLEVNEKELKESKTNINQAFNLMDMVKDVSSIKSTILMIEKEDGSFKLSLRSKNKDLLPLVKNFNGGGHRHSAGATVHNKNWADIKKQILEYFK